MMGEFEYPAGGRPFGAPVGEFERLALQQELSWANMDTAPQHMVRSGVPHLPNGTVACFFGNLGMGKTLGMTVLAHLVRHRKVYANYGCSFAEEITSLRHLVDIKEGLLLLDEAWGLFDSRQFKQNVDLTQWLMLIRKLGLSMFYTSQQFGGVDIRLRGITDIAVHCRRIGRPGRYATLCTVFRVEGDTLRYVRRYNLPHTQAAYDLYDTKDTRIVLTPTGRETPWEKIYGAIDNAGKKPPKHGGATPAPPSLADETPQPPPGPLAGALPPNPGDSTAGGSAPGMLTTEAAADADSYDLAADATQRAADPGAIAQGRRSRPRF